MNTDEEKFEKFINYITSHSRTSFFNRASFQEISPTQLGRALIKKINRTEEPTGKYYLQGKTKLSTSLSMYSFDIFNESCLVNDLTIEISRANSVEPGLDVIHFASMNDPDFNMLLGLHYQQEPFPAGINMRQEGNTVAISIPSVRDNVNGRLITPLRFMQIEKEDENLIAYYHSSI